MLKTVVGPARVSRGDRSLEHWRAEHERFFTEHATTGFDPQMLLVLERFRVVYAGD